MMAGEAGRMVYTVVPAAAPARVPRGEEEARPLLYVPAAAADGLRAGEEEAKKGGIASLSSSSLDSSS